MRVGSRIADPIFTRDRTRSSSPSTTTEAKKDEGGPQGFVV